MCISISSLYFIHIIDSLTCLYNGKTVCDTFLTHQSRLQSDKSSFYFTRQYSNCTNSHYLYKLISTLFSIAKCIFLEKSLPDTEKTQTRCFKAYPQMEYNTYMHENRLYTISITRFHEYVNMNTKLL